MATIKNPKADGSRNQLDTDKEEHNNLVIGYKALRNFVGFAGIILPFWLMQTAFQAETDPGILPSISDYFHSTSGDVLVVVVALLAAFLIFYKGYNLIENMLTTLAGIAVLMVGFFPTATKPVPYRFSKSIHIEFVDVPELAGIELHFLFAGLFFLCITILCLAYFPISTKENITTRKKIRNAIYFSCGFVMAACVIGILVVAFLQNDHPQLRDASWIFWLETVALIAFGIAWLTKGETILPDNWSEHYVLQGARQLGKAIKEKR